ncbi:retention module-containing protein [Methylophaga thiooxydans]|uniref:Type I secretion target GGXGXDXXX repeat protein domain protein n=1 Tax=Methylophaga thiooxydans DMS010 TaxID=637616 RepID=C0N8P3_9GAMM|nr:retention module-containing protein [Methylophaga thiooxydans]EEF78887.1 type I secretion target GGXGXDXXX repeat protein domain protein [Methylophaga thiooxydans DMS010]
MATQIGVIKAVLGTVTATAMDGSTRTLQIGDRVYANELISTGQSGAVEIEFADGSVMDLGRNSQAMLDNGVFDPEATSVADAPSEDIPEDVAAIQQALLDGEDPTEVGEATAAGAGVTGTGNEGHEAVFVNYLNPEVTPEAGFDTIGVNNEIEDLEEEQLIDGTPTAGTITVLLDEDDLSSYRDFDSSVFLQNLLGQIQPEFQTDTSLFLSNGFHMGVGDTATPGDDLPSPTPTFFSGALNANFGSDGPGSISFNPVGSQPSGLTSGGQPVQIWVSADGLTLIGYIAAENGDYPYTVRQISEGPQFDGAEIIFSAQIDPATLNFSAGIYGPLDHADTAEEGAFEENLLINMAFTITDSDGDSAQGIVQLNVDDDSPVIGEQQDYPQEGRFTDSPFDNGASVDEDDTDNGVGNIDSPGDDYSSPYITLPINFGADGPAAENPVEISAEGIVDQFGNSLTSNGVEVQFNWNALTNTLEGTADGQPVINIHVSVWEFGPGTQVNIELLDNLDHPVGADGESLGTEDNLNLVLNYTATDADGDQAYGSFDLSIDDDMPVIGTPEAVSVDEEGINGNAGDSYAEGATVVLGQPADGVVDHWHFTHSGGELVINIDSERYAGDLNGDSVTDSFDSQIYLFNADTGQLVGTDDDGDPVDWLDSELSFSDLPEGNYQLAIGDWVLTEAEARSGAHDGPMGPYHINFSTGVVITALPAGGSIITGDDGDDLPGEATVAGGSLAINWGADDNNDAESDFDRSVAFTEQVAPEGLTADGQPVSYSINEDGSMLTAYTGEQGTDSYSEVFTVTVSDEDNGSYTFTLLGNLDHPEANTEDDIDLSFEFIATDSDGDSAVGSFNVTVDDDAPVASGETVEFTIDEDDIRTELSEGNEPNDGDDTDGSFTGSPLSPFDNGPANVSGSVASLVSFGADGAGSFTLADNFDALLAQNLTSQGEALSYSVDGNVLTAEADGREVFTLTLNENGDFTFALSDQLDHADANGENNLPLDLSSVIVATDADGDAITLESGFVINVTDDVPEQAGWLPEVGIVEEEALPSGNQELDDFITTIDLGPFGTITIAVDGWPDTAIATGSLADQVNVGADEPATFTLSGDYTQLIAQNLTSDDEPLSYAVQGNTLYAVANQTPIFTLTLDANGDYTFTLMGPLDHADGILEENLLSIDFSTLVVVTDADGDQITLDENFFIEIVDDSPEVGNNARVRLDDDALEGGNPGGPGDNTDSANVTGTLSHSFGADGGSISWQTSGAPNGFSYEADGDDLLVKQDGETVLTLTLDPQTGEYSVTQNAPIDHRDNGNNNENNQNFNIGYLVTDGDGDTATGSLRVNVDDDTPTVADYEVNTMRIISDDDTVAGLNGNPGGVGDSNEYNQVKTLQFSVGADGGTVAWNTDTSSVEDATAGITFVVDGDGSLLIMQDQGGAEPVQVAIVTLDENTGDYVYTQTANVLHTPGNDENEASFKLGFTVTDGDGDTADGYVTLLIDDDTPTVADYEVNTMRIISDDDTVAGLNGNPGGVGDSNEYNQVKTLQFSVGADGGTVAWNTDTSSVEDATAGITFVVDGDGSLLIMQDQGGAEPVQVAIVTLDENTGDYVYTQTANVLHTPGNDENEASFKLGFTVTDGDGDTADGYVTLLIDDDTPTVADYEVNTMRIISDDDTVAGLDGNPGEGANTNDGAGTDSKEYNQTGTLQFSAGADGGTVAWNTDTSSVDDATAGISFSVNAEGSLILTQQQDGVPVEIAVITLDENTGDYTYTQTGNVLHTAGDAENEAAFTLGFTVTDGDGDTADGHLTLLIDDDTPVITSQQINLLSESFENFAPELSNNNWTVVGEGGGTIIGNNGIEWTVNGAGIEIQTGNVGGSSASDGNAHAELDAHDSNGDGGTTLTVLSTQVDLPTPDAILSFDFKPRPGSVADSDISVSLGGNTVTLDTDAAGNIDFGTLPAGVTATQSTSANGWTTVTLSFTGLDTDSAQTLAFEGLGNANSLGGYLDNINLNAGVSLTVDESALADGNSEAGASTVASFDFSGFFTGEFGADGAGSESYSLNLNGSDVASGLFAVDSTDTVTTDGDGFGQGSEIVLNEVNGDIIGSVGGVEYFTISVNAETGEVTLTQLDNIWQPDAQNPDDSQSLVLDAETLSLIKEITDADADSASASLDLSGGLFNFEDDAPTISSEQPAVSLEMTVTNHNEVSSAGYNSSYGYYIKGENGDPTDGVIIWNNVQDPANESATVTLEGVSADQVGFFIIPNGFTNNGGLENDTEVTFVKDSSGHWEAQVNGQPLAGSGSNVLFDVAALNNDGQDHVQDNALTGNQNWEDLQIPTGDGDYNDVNVNVELTRVGGITVDETDLDSSASDSMNLAGSFDISFGADGEGNVAYALSVDTEVETGLVDTLSDKPVQLRINGAGEVEGYITTDDNFDLVVFTASVDAAGEVTLTQQRAVEHDDVEDHDEALSPATINAGAIALVATVTDADGDTAADSIDVGVLFAFEDDGPSVGEQTATEVDEGETVDGQLVFDAGEDGGEVTAVNGTTLTFGQDGFSQEIELDHGTLQVKANGEYSYSVDSGSVEQDEVENFNFTVTDGDGDTAQGAVAITIVNAQVADVITLNDVTVNEGDGTATITGSVENAVTGTPLVITLDNGAIITIPVGATSADSTPFVVQGDDVIIDGEDYTVGVTGTTGGDFSSLDTSDTSTVTINDTIDDVTVVLSATNSTSEDGGSITYTASLVDGDNNPVTTANAITVTLDNGETITIAAGSSSSDSAPVAVERDDVYLETDSIDNSITGVSEANAGSDGAFENLGYDASTVSTTITDDSDAVTVVLSATNSTSEDGGSITYTASLVDGDNNPVTTANAITVTLDNGETITIAAGSSSSDSAPVAVERDDVYLETDSIDNSITSVSEANAGSDGAFENLGYDASTVSTTITDDSDAVTATLSTSTTDISEDGGDIIYTVTLTGGPGAIDPDANLVINLANSEQVTILAGQTSGSVTATYTDAEITNQTAITNSISGVASGGTEYESLQTAGSTSVDVNYGPVIEDLTPQAQGGDVSVDEDDLTDGSDTSKESTTQEGTFTISAADGIDDLTIGGEAVITDGVFSATSFTTGLGNTLSVTGFDAGTGEITYTYELVDNTLTHGPANDGQNNVFENFDVVLSDVDGDLANDTLSVEIVDDVPTATADSVESNEGSSSTLGADLVLMIDRSGSVSNSDLDSLKSSLQTLFNNGSVHSVFITSFSSGGQFHDSGVDGGWFTNLNDAMNVINGLSSGGTTDYDAALEAVTDNFTAPPAGGGQLVSMFISDGEPNETNNTGSYGIIGSEEANWINFLDSNGFDDSYAVGYNGLDSGDIGYLEPIAWTEGETSSTYTGSDDDNVIILDDIDDLAVTFGSTVTATPNPVIGNVLDNDEAGADGYGTPILVDVTYDGNTVTFSGSTTSATFDTDAGTVVINSDGSYEFTGLSDTDTDVSSVINYTMQDADGDQASSNLTVSTQDSVPVAENDTDSVEEATWSFDGTEFATVTTENWSDTPDQDSYNINHNINPGWSADAATTGNIEIDADNDHQANILIDIDISSYRSDDQILAQLYKVVDGGSDQLVENVDINFDQTVSFDGIDESGQYYVRLYGDDNTWSGNLRASMSNLRVNSFDFTQNTYSTTVNTAALAALAAATGNVLANDDAGADGGLSVTVVNGDPVSGSTDIDGLYGTLTIDENGDYSYTPNAEDLPAGSSESFTYTVVDADGSEDTATLTIDINDHDYVVDENDNVVVADAAGESVSALGGDDVLIGSDQADTLNGGAGDDNLMGNGGDDTLIGGAGNDILTGGAGADIFQWNDGDEGTAGSPAVDFITDFSAAEGDSLDLADLLQGEESGDITDYISVAQNGSDVVIEVTPEGNGGDMNQIITLQNTTVDQLAGGDTSGMSQADIINTLITNGQLNVDQS